MRISVHRMRREVMISCFAARLLTQWSTRPFVVAALAPATAFAPFQSDCRSYTSMPIFDANHHRPSPGCHRQRSLIPILHHPSRLHLSTTPSSSLPSSSANSSSSSSSSGSRLRSELLQEQLQKLGVDASSLHQADVSFLQDPTQGYDPRFGKSAIRCYRAFLRPSPQASTTSKTNTMEEEDNDDTARQQLVAAAGRCARQVDFLIKRHKSHQAEWIRHHDAALQERTRVFPLIIVLDNVRSAFNVGSLFRTADACGCQQVITTGITPYPHGNGADKLNKSALGAEHLVPSRHFGTTQEALNYLRSELPDFTVIGMETTAKSQLYTETKYSTKGVVLVLGNEVTGVDTEILSQLDGIVEIPTFGAKNSLNVAACAPVVLYEIIRQWQVR